MASGAGMERGAGAGGLARGAGAVEPAVGEWPASPPSWRGSELRLRCCSESEHAWLQGHPGLSGIPGQREGTTPHPVSASSRRPLKMFLLAHKTSAPYCFNSLETPYAPSA